MIASKTGIKFTLLIAALLAGCDKGQSNTSTTPQSSSPSANTPTPAPAMVNELVATYNAVSDVEGTNEKRHQALTLNADGTAQLDTKVPTPAGTKTSDATGTYTAKGVDVVVNFTAKDGKPIPAGDSMHTMRMTQNKANNSLLDEDGRTFVRAK